MVKKLLLMLLISVAMVTASELGQKLTADGWCFVPPRPKSAQAAPGNTDRRTTWWEGYWENPSISECSKAVPRYLPKQDIVVGDDSECRDMRSTYRYGGYYPNSNIETECLCEKYK